MESLSKHQLIYLKQETTYVASWIGTFHFFFLSALPSPTLYRRLIKMGYPILFSAPALFISLHRHCSGSTFLDS